jgi:hypothetical protein
MWGRSRDLCRFDFCAECLGSFITDNLGRTEKDEELPLGFTVSGYVPILGFRFAVLIA